MFRQVMGPLLIANPMVCLQHFIPVLTRNILNVSYKNVPACFKLGGMSTFCTKRINKKGVPIRKDFKSNEFVIKENPAFPKSVFAAGNARRTSALLKRRADISDLGEQSDYRNRDRKRDYPIPDRPLTVSEWKRLKEDSKNPRSFETQIMGAFLKSSAEVDTAKSLLAYVAIDTGTVSYELLLLYLAFCVHGGHWAEMFDVYDIMKSRFRTLDTGAYSLLIKGFSKTGRWEEALVFLENIKGIKASPRNYSDIIAGAVQHGNMATAWTLYNQLLERGITPNQDTWKYLFEGGISDHENDDKLLSILEHMRDSQIYPEESLAHNIWKWFECRPDQKWTGSISTVNPSGVCESCQSMLESIHLTKEDYADLKDSIMKNVIEGKDVFNKTTPEELESFKHFVSQQPPFDVVIDGLNVAYSQGKGNQSNTLLAVVSKLHQQGLSILVLGRKHMLKDYKSYHMRKIQQKAHCFFTEDISEDDPFLLYAALHSGSHCTFVSRDLMRDHKACLSSGRTRRLFFKWQRGHQLVLRAFLPGEKVYFQEIQSYDTIAQTSGDSWHIPFDQEGTERSTYEVPQKWLCLTRSN
ncbi:mitochondrial ribonuclease P catalytic subunit [Sardina pilchardus]|uniref:mitochondrial ribonuclease P catalytic subunit n=1 Tax=Sardina pilchardus TaxID=27697 RepID=UPI002E0F1986